MKPILTFLLSLSVLTPVLATANDLNTYEGIIKVGRLTQESLYIVIKGEAAEAMFTQLAYLHDASETDTKNGWTVEEIRNPNISCRRLIARKISNKVALLRNSDNEFSCSISKHKL